MKLPKVGSPSATIAAYMLHNGYNEKSQDEGGTNILQKLSKKDKIEDKDLQDALQRADGRIPLHEQFSALTPNLSYGPITIAQKLIIRDNYPDANGRNLATYLRTSQQNVNMAKRGEFVEPLPELPTLDSSRPFGPLTYDEQVHIQTHCATHNTKMLAKEYNTHYNNIYRAQRGEFPRPHALRKVLVKREFGPLNLLDKREIRDHRSEEPAVILAKEYNTNYGNVTRAQQGLFKDNATPEAPSVFVQHQRLLEGLLGHGYTLTDGTALEALVKEILA